LSMKSFHGVLAGNVHKCLLKTSIGKVSYIHPRGRNHFVAAVQKMLIPGGYFAVDTLSRCIDSSGARAPAAVLIELTHQAGSRIVTQLATFKKKSCTSVFVFQNSDGTKPAHEMHVQYYCNGGTLAHVMRSCGFSLVAAIPVSLPTCLPIETRPR
jgi:hypothetical protein